MFLGWLICFFGILLPQPEHKDDQLFFGLQAHATRVAPHYKDMIPYTSGIRNAFELQAGYRRNSNSTYNRIFNYPAVGVSLFRGSPGKKEVVGTATSFLGFMEFALLEKKLSALRIKYSFGIAHFSKFYDAETNPTNEAIGARFNAHVNLNFSYNYHFSGHLDFSAGVGLTHFSNGAYIMPNKGINMYDINAGLRYYLRPRIQQPHFDNKKMMVIYKPKLRLHAIYTAGIMQLDFDPAFYTVSDFSLNLSVQTHYKARAGIGLDLFYNQSTFDIVKNGVEKYPFLNSLRGGINGAFELDFNRLMVVYNLGFYAFYQAEPIKPMYQRIGLRYSLGNRLFVAMALKAHRNKAEYTQFGLGYTILNHTMKKTGLRDF